MQHIPPVRSAARLAMKIVFFSRADNQLSSVAPSRTSTNQYQPYTSQDIQFIRDRWNTMTLAEIAQALNRPRNGIRSYAYKVLRLRKSDEARFLARSKAQQSRKDAYSETEKQFLRDNWQTMTRQEMATALGRTPGSIRAMGTKKLRLCKTDQAISALCRRANGGQFQKGQLPANTVFGDEMIIRIRNNKKRDIKTKFIRLGFKRWQEYQHYVWEQANGPVPKGMILAFINGDRLDVRLDNLTLITKADNALRNSGSINLSDGNVAHALAWHDKELADDIRMNHPELIELKRAQLQLNRTINHVHAKPTKTR